MTSARGTRKWRLVSDGRSRQRLLPDLPRLDELGSRPARALDGQTVADRGGQGRAAGRVEPAGPGTPRLCLQPKRHQGAARAGL